MTRTKKTLVAAAFAVALGLSSATPALADSHASVVTPQDSHASVATPRTATPAEPHAHARVPEPPARATFRIPRSTAIPLDARALESHRPYSIENAKVGP